MAVSESIHLLAQLQIAFERGLAKARPLIAENGVIPNAYKVDHGNSSDTEIKLPGSGLSLAQNPDASHNIITEA
jgi:hypothetical protein